MIHSIDSIALMRCIAFACVSVPIYTENIQFKFILIDSAGTCEFEFMAFLYTQLVSNTRLINRLLS